MNILKLSQCKCCSFLLHFLHSILWLFSRFYLGIVACSSIRRKKELPCPVISVGNIVLGGTGKTPAVEMVARTLTAWGYRVAILSRGYRRKATRSTAGFGTVSDGKRILLGSEEGGDEPQLLAKNLPGVAVLVGKDRFLTGNFAEEEYGCNAIILDDGYQYSVLKRDLDIAVINASYPFGNGYLLPRGTLREPKTSLKRANLFLLTHVDESAGPSSSLRTGSANVLKHGPQGRSLENLRQELEAINPSAPVVESIHSPMYLQDIGTHSRLELDFLQDRDIFVVSSIGRPQSFEKTLEKLGANLRDSFRFLDHHRYSFREIDKIRCRAQEEEVETIVTTQKDAMQLDRLGDSFLRGREGICHSNILALIIELKIIRGGEILDRMLRTALRQ